MYPVILIDDESWALTDLKIFLSDFPEFEIINEFDNAANACEYLCNYLHSAIVFTDIKMPQMSGLELIEKVKAANLKITFVVVSAYEDFEYAQKAIKLNVLDYLLKPIIKEEFSKTITNIRKRLRNASNNDKHEYIIIPHHNINNPVFEKIVKYLEENKQKAITLSDLADIYHVSESYCSQLFKKYFNMSFSDYMFKLKMDYAYSLLKKGKPIKEVALELGYDYSYFHKRFKKYYNKTPKELERDISER